MEPKSHKIIFFSKSFFPIFTGISCGFVMAQSVDVKKPNILIIIADDMGFSDAGCYGSEIQTPNLDRLASNGLRYTQFYNTGRSWPSRTSMMTGYYAQSIRRDNISDLKTTESYKAGGAGVRPSWAQLLPVYLQNKGYHSYHSGKWHIDGKPLENGFEHSFVSMNIDGFFTISGDDEDGKKINPSTATKDYYSTIATADYAIKYLQEHSNKYANQPFFEYVAFHSPHFPIQALPQDIAVYKDQYKSGWDAMRKERFERLKKLGIINCNLSNLEPDNFPKWNLKEAEMQKRIGNEEVGRAESWESLTAEQKTFQAEKMAVHAAMVHRMDIEIGRILDQIKAMGVLDNTLIFFLSDNGASAEQIIRGKGHVLGSVPGSDQSYLGIGAGWASAANTPLRLHKTWNHEGGISTPLIVYWPKGIKARGELRNTPGHLVDIVPTVMDIVGEKQPATFVDLPVPPFQGISQYRNFAKDGATQHEYIWWNHIGNKAMRVGDWKLVAQAKASWELYDMKTDRAESNNLANTNIEKVIELNHLWMKHAIEFDSLARLDLKKEDFENEKQKKKNEVNKAKKKEKKTDE